MCLHDNFLSHNFDEGKPLMGVSSEKTSSSPPSSVSSNLRAQKSVKPWLKFARVNVTFFQQPLMTDNSSNFVEMQASNGRRMYDSCVEPPQRALPPLRFKTFSCPSRKKNSNSYLLASRQHTIREKSSQMETFARLSNHKVGNSN